MFRREVIKGGDVSPEREERRFAKHIDNRRKQLAESRNKKSSWMHTHSVPADLYHGKIRETGDKSYWDDPKNLSRHSSCKVS